MSYATEMLSKAQAAYSRALDTGQSVGHGDSRLTQFELQNLRKEVSYWEAKVAQETAAAAGNLPARSPFQVML
jgi:hypothetical protein